MKKIIYSIVVIVLSFFGWNCDTNDPGSNIDEFSDEVIKSAVYNEPKYPTDFYTEGLFQTVLIYISESDSLTFTEPSTNDYGTALDLVNNRAVELNFDTTHIINGQSNEKYFEFHCPSPARAAFYIFRVHKRSYFEGVEFLGSSDLNLYYILELGNINHRPITRQFVKDFFDQLWFYKHFDITGAIVLKRTIAEKQFGYHYTIYFTHTILGDSGLHDKIRLYKGEFSLNKWDGTSQINYRFIKEVLGNYN